MTVKIFERNDINFGISSAVKYMNRLKIKKKKTALTWINNSKALKFKKG